MFFEDNIDDAKYCGHLYGLGQGSGYVQNGSNYENHNSVYPGPQNSVNNVTTETSTTPTTTSSSWHDGPQTPPLAHDLELNWPPTTSDTRSAKDLDWGSTPNS